MNASRGMSVDLDLLKGPSEPELLSLVGRRIGRVVRVEPFPLVNIAVHVHTKHASSLHEEGTRCEAKDLYDV